MATTRGSAKLGVILQLEALAIHHEQLAAAIRTTLSLVRSAAKVPKEDASSLLSQALLVDVARRGTRRGRPPLAASNGNGNGNGHGELPHPKQTVASLHEQRQHSATFLARFNPSTPTRDTSGYRGMGSLVRRGYLERRVGGYIRTAKPYVVDPHDRGAEPAAATKAAKVLKHGKKRGYWDKAATEVRRKKTAAVLATYDTKKAKPLVHKAGLGALIAAGYLRHQGDGYVRTAKAFVP